MFTQHWAQKPLLGVHINPAHPLAKGLIGCWLFNEGSGDKAYDLSGYGNHGILGGMAFPSSVDSGWNPGRDGPVLAFDGTNDYVDCGSDIIISTHVTIAVWFWLDVLGSYPALVTRGGADATNWEISIHSFFEYELYYGLIGAALLYSDTLVPLGAWVSAVLTIGADGAKFYRNGVEDGSDGGITALRAAPDSLFIGNRPVAASYFNGPISRVYIYNRALTAQEVLELYTNPYGMFDWPLIWSAEAPPPPVRAPRPPAVSGVPSAHF